MKVWQVFLIAVGASILTNCVGGCINSSVKQYQEFKQYQQTILNQQKQEGDNKRPFEDGRDDVAVYIASFIPPTATTADADEIAEAFRTVAKRVEDGTLTGREDTTADLNRELQAAADRDKWGSFFVGLYPLIGLTANDLRKVGDEIQKAVKKPILRAVSALREATEEKPTENPTADENAPESTPAAEPETPEPTGVEAPEPAEPEAPTETPETKPAETPKPSYQRNYYRPFPMLPPPPIMRWF